MNKDSQAAPGGAEVTHTPGPYSIGRGKEEQPVTIRDPLGRVVALLPNTGAHGTHDLRLGSPSSPDGIAANARLIAAAPDLLEATRAAYRVLAYPTAMGTDLLEATRLELRAAIAKATEED